MSDLDNFENTKKIIRSILISYPRGCSFDEFKRGYKTFVGNAIPCRELGFSSDLELLYSMPDVVSIDSYGNGKYHLIGIADEKSMHIQKLVRRQKPSKQKHPSRPPIRSQIWYTVPPRFHKIQPNDMYSSSQINLDAPKQFPKHEIVFVVKQYSTGSGLNVTEFMQRYEQEYGRSLLYNNFGFSSLIDSLESIPELKVVKYAYGTYIKYNHVGTDNTEKIFKETPNSETVLSDKVSASVTNFEMSGNSYSSGSQVNQTSQMSSFQLQTKCNESSWRSSDFLPIDNYGESCMKGSYELGYSVSERGSSVHSISPPTCNKYDELDVFELNDVDSNNSTVPGSLKMSHLRKIAEKYPNGILAADFPSLYEKITGFTFDLQDFGYNCLADFIDSIPDIFVRKSVVGSKKNWLIYPADVPESSSKDQTSGIQLLKSGVLFIDVIANIKNLLEVYNEGIKLDEFLNLYSINFNDPLHLKDLGFCDIEEFLQNISERVPLEIKNSGNYKTAHLIKFNSTPPCTVPQMKTLPSDISPISSQYEQPQLPSNLSHYIPAFTSAIASPTHLYLQLGDEASESLTELTEMIDTFYNGPQSVLYTMQNIHIVPGTICIALWPADRHWYRAKIISVVSADFVEVCYVDYGTKEVISNLLLRYIKECYVKLPALAIKTRLAFLKPANNASKWDPKAGQRLMDLCQDISLMAKIEEIDDDGTLSVVLCDTNGVEDVYINDVLIKEGLAVAGTEDTCDNPSIPNHNLCIFSAADCAKIQYHLTLLAADVPSVTSNEHFMALFKQTSLVNVTHQSTASLPLDSTSLLGAREPNALLNSFENSNYFSSFLLQSQSNELNIENSSILVKKSNLSSSPSLRNQANQSNLSNLPSRGKQNELLNLPNSSLTENQNNDNETLVGLSNSTNQVSSHNSLSLEISGHSENGNKNPRSEPLVEIVASAHEKSSRKSPSVENSTENELFRQLCSEVLSAKRFVKRVKAADGYVFHIIKYASTPHVSSGDVSNLIWSNKEDSYLFRKMQSKNMDIPWISVSEDGDNNHTMFYQLRRYNVKGIQKTSDSSKCTVFLYKLKDVLKILNTFGHPSILLRKKIMKEIMHCDQSDHWLEYHPDEVIETNESEKCAAVTDDDKLYRLCLPDLVAMRESLRCKRLMMVSNLKNANYGNANYVDEIQKLEDLHAKVLLRISEIENICKLFP